MEPANGKDMAGQDNTSPPSSRRKVRKSRTPIGANPAQQLHQQHEQHEQEQKQEKEEKGVERRKRQKVCQKAKAQKREVDHRGRVPSPGAEEAEQAIDNVRGVKRGEQKNFVDHDQEGQFPLPEPPPQQQQRGAVNASSASTGLAAEASCTLDEYDFDRRWQRLQGAHQLQSSSNKANAANMISPAVPSTTSKRNSKKRKLAVEQRIALSEAPTQADAVWSFEANEKLQKTVARAGDSSPASARNHRRAREKQGSSSRSPTAAKKVQTPSSTSSSHVQSGVNFDGSSNVFACGVCQQDFQYKYQLRVHQKRCH
mmetsp:Transcript_20065/g.28227  ORF Transcript_20065/g.28227 Transcript_20065/m.28227 type:complete len:313 (-) Transcript_20065:119-1057(-)